MIRDVSSNELFTVLAVFCLFLIAAAKLVSYKRFSDFLFVFTNSKYLKIYSREQKFFDKFDALLFVNSVISLAIFFVITYQFIDNNIEVSVNLMFKLIVGISAFLLIKVLFERLIGSLFEIDNLIDQYLFQKITYKNYLGIILLPLNVILIYFLGTSKLILYGMFVLLILVVVRGLVSSLKSHQNLLKNNLFYFILYLCALEIAPYIILYKVFVSN